MTGTETNSLPLVEDAADLLVGGGHGFLGRGFLARRLREHRRNHERVEDLVDPRGRVTRIPDVRRPFEDVAEDLVLVRRHALWVAGELGLDVRHRARETR